MRKTFLKTISTTLLLVILCIATALIIYPQQSEIRIFFAQFNTEQIAHNTTLNIFSQISTPTVAGIEDENSSNDEKLEQISQEDIKEHRQEYGVVQLERKNTTLKIDSVDIDGVVVDGDDATSMDRGFWHYPISSPPGERGNTVIIGHRFLNIPPRTDTFFNLNEVNIGDTITIEQERYEYTYTVIQTLVVDKNNTSALEDTNDYRITLITCEPLWSSEKRLVVVGKMDDIYGNI